MSEDRPEPAARSQNEAAAILGLQNRASIQDYLSRGCPGDSSQNYYPLVQMRKWIRDNIPQDGRAIGGEKPPETDVEAQRELADLRKAEADAATKETKLDLLLGRLVEREAIESELRSLLNAMRHRLQAIPEEIGATIAPEWRLDVTLDLKTKIELVLREIASWSHSPPIPERFKTIGTSAPSLGKPNGSGVAVKQRHQSKSRQSSRGRGRKS